MISTIISSGKSLIVLNNGAFFASLAIICSLIVSADKSICSPTTFTISQNLVNFSNVVFSGIAILLLRCFFLHIFVKSFTESLNIAPSLITLSLSISFNSRIGGDFD